jgi:chorismate-pyruvate lyase
MFHGDPPMRGKACCSFPPEAAAGGPASRSPQALSARLLAADSATRTLQAWCEEHAIGSGPVWAEVQRQGNAEAWRDGPDDDLLDHLGRQRGEAMVARQVILRRGAVPLSEAMNWYLPDRLTPAMRHALASSETPFGVVIRPLQPRRQTVFVALATDRLEHRAVVRAGDGRPLAAVIERYQPAVLGYHI